MKQFVKIGKNIIATSEIVSIDTERKKVYLKNREVLHYTKEDELNQLEEADPTDKIFEILEATKEQVKTGIFKNGCEVDILSTFTICELVEELNRREGVERKFIAPHGVEKFVVQGPGILVIIKD